MDKGKLRKVEWAVYDALREVVGNDTQRSWLSTLVDSLLRERQLKIRASKRAKHFEAKYMNLRSKVDCLPICVDELENS